MSKLNNYMLHKSLHAINYVLIHFLIHERVDVS